MPILTAHTPDDGRFDDSGDDARYQDDDARGTNDEPQFMAPVAKTR